MSTIARGDADHLRAILILAAIAASLSGCRGEFEFLGSRQHNPPIILQPGQAIQEPNEEVEAAPAQAMCQARAKLFRGTVQIPCVDVARIIAP